MPETINKLESLVVCLLLELHGQSMDRSMGVLGMKQYNVFWIKHSLCEQTSTLFATRSVEGNQRMVENYFISRLKIC